MSGVLAFEAGSCGHEFLSQTWDELGWSHSIHIGSLISYRARAFCSMLQRQYSWPVTMYQGVRLSVRVPSELLEAQVQAKWCLTCLSSILKISSGQFPETGCSPCSHLVGKCF